MNECGYNFRSNLNYVKTLKNAKLKAQVDDFLRGLINELSKEEEFFSEEMLNEILFLQADEYSGETIEVYLKMTYPDSTDEDFPYEFITDRNFGSFAEAAAFLEAVCMKLKSEDFIIEEYDDTDYASDGGKSFIAKSSKK